jgi:hypothetical protein
MFSKYSIMVICITVISVVVSSISSSIWLTLTFLFLLIMAEFVNFVNIFKEPTHSLIICIVLLVSISLVSFLIFIISSVYWFWDWIVFVFLRTWGEPLGYLFVISLIFFFIVGRQLWTFLIKQPLFYHKDFKVVVSFWFFKNFFIIHLFTCAYIVWVIYPPSPPPLAGTTCSALTSNFVEEKP